MGWVSIASNTLPSCHFGAALQAKEADVDLPLEWREHLTVAGLEVGQTGTPPNAVREPAPQTA